MKKSKEIAFLGLVSALSSVCLLLGTIVSALDMSSAILASLLLVITFEELRWKSVLVYFATLVISLSYTLFAAPLATVEYLIFALFPLLLPLFNKLPTVLGYIVKALYALVASAAAVAVTCLFVPGTAEKPYMPIVYLLVHVLVIVIFDLLIFRFRRYYFFKLRHTLRIDRFFK